VRVDTRLGGTPEAEIGGGQDKQSGHDVGGSPSRTQEGIRERGQWVGIKLHQWSRFINTFNQISTNQIPSALQIYAQILGRKDAYVGIYL
jgi:hypothetical protein